MQRATQSPQPERLYDRLEACASGLAEAALEQAMLPLTMVTHEAAVSAQNCSPAELARAGVILSGPAAGGLAQAPADLALKHGDGGLRSTADPGALGLAEAEPAGLSHGPEQLWDRAPTARDAAAGASPRLCTPRSSRAGVLEDHENSCELGRASSGSGAGSPAPGAAHCRSSGGQRSCDGAAGRATALECVQPSQAPRSGHSPDPDPNPGQLPASPRSCGCVTAAGSAKWELSPDRDPRPERRRWLSRSACELGNASSSAGGDMDGIGNLNLPLDAASALPAAPNGLRDSDKEIVTAVAAACGLDGSRGEVGLSADGGGLGREGALLASEFAGLGMLTGFQGTPGGGGSATIGDSSPSAAGCAWGAPRWSSSATLIDLGSWPPVRGALSEATSLGSSQARRAAAAGPGVALGSGEAYEEAEACVQSRSGACSPAAGRGILPSTMATDAGEPAASERAALEACGEQQTASSDTITAHSEPFADKSRWESLCEHGPPLPQALHGSDAGPAMRVESQGTGAAAAAAERSACAAHPYPAGEQAPPRSQTLQTLPGSGVRTNAHAARSDCGSANGDPNSGSRVSGSRVVRDGAALLLSSSSELVPLGPGGSGGGAGLLRAAGEPGEVQSAPEAGSRGRGGLPPAKPSLDGAWGVPPNELILRCEALSPGPRPPHGWACAVSLQCHVFPQLIILVMCTTGHVALSTAQNWRSFPGAISIQNLSDALVLPSN